MAGYVLSPEQATSLARVIAALREVGYSSELIRENYPFEDWFAPNTPERVSDAVAFAQKPFAYDTACFAVAASREAQGVELIQQLRALGAPRGFEVARDGRVYHWRVSENPRPEDRQEVIRPGEIESAFAAHRDRWSPDALFRQRAHPHPSQRDFIDLGLIPALEEHVRVKLGPRLEDILLAATGDIRQRTGRPPDLPTLFRLIFRGIAGKVMRDRNHPKFKRFNKRTPADELFGQVADHYGEKAGAGDRFTKKLIYDALWSGFSLRHLSVDVLAFLYEDFLVSPDLRATRGIHATPPSVARYLVNRLPLEDVPDGRTVVEPCCGGAAFLLAALQRFRQVLPRTTRPANRHEYARSRLFGADVDAFALEVARCSLMLSDYPNRNGWQLERENVFESPAEAPAYHAALSRAKIVLCNPPFEDIRGADRKRYGVKNPRAPAELIRRILAHAPSDVSLGFVLPTQAVDGKSYADVRAQLAERFAELELVHLPDDTFKHAELPTAMLLARRPEPGQTAVSVAVGAVPDLARFTRTGRAEDQFAVSRTVGDLRFSLDPTRFWKAWDALGVSAESHSLVPHRGVEWKSSVPKERRTSAAPQPGFKLGYHSTGEIALYEAPPPAYLNARREDNDWNAWDLPWDLPKVFLNRARASRGPWRLAAFPVNKERACSENFIAIWPPADWTANALAAVLNGPVASAFVATHDRDRDNKTTTLARMPLPTLDQEAVDKLDAMVTQYIAAVDVYRGQKERRAVRRTEAQSAGLFDPPKTVPAEPSADQLRAMVLEIDLLVLAGYDLPPPVERDIVNFFRGHPRPLPFDFPDYETRLIRRRLEEQTRALDEDADEQRVTWAALKKQFDEDRLSSRSLIP